MPKANPWHSRNKWVYHDNTGCTIGQAIPGEQRVPGTGAKRRCDECSRLNWNEPIYTGRPEATRVRAMRELQSAIVSAQSEAARLGAPAFLRMALDEALAEVAVGLQPGERPERAIHHANASLENFRAWLKWHTEGEP